MSQVLLRIRNIDVTMKITPFKSYIIETALIVLFILEYKVYGQIHTQRGHTGSSLFPITDSTNEGKDVTSYLNISSYVTTPLYTDTLVEKNCTQLKSITFLVSEVYLSLCYRLKRKCEGWLTNRKCKNVPIGLPCTKTRVVERVRYEDEEVCCDGYIPVNGTNMCERGCRTGYFGDRCQYSCLCSSNALPGCDVNNGTCICKAGWRGDFCEQKCGTGWYGMNCQYKCLCKNNATCHHVHGTCNCTVPGYTGNLCEIRCKPGRFGYNCSEECSCHERQTCNPETGSCECDAGWTGINCTTHCRSGFFGEKCSKKCLCETNNSCHHVTGKCECSPGKTGNRCEKECEEGRFGEGCNSVCSCNEREICNPITGDCTTAPRCTCNALGTSNCIDQRPYCSCEELQKYLVSSSQTSNETFKIGIVQNPCKNSIGIVQFCIPNDVNCLCKPGYVGETCGKVCPPSFYGLKCQNTCKCGPGETCRPQDGKCTAVASSTPSPDILDYILDETVSGFIVFGYLGIIAVSLCTVIAYCCCCRNPKDNRKEKLKRIADVNKEADGVAVAMHTLDSGAAVYSSPRNTENNNVSTETCLNGTTASFKIGKPNIMPRYDVPTNGRPVPLHYCNSVWQGEQCEQNPIEPMQNNTRKTKIINVATDFNRTNSLTKEQLNRRQPSSPLPQNTDPYINLQEHVDVQARTEMYEAVVSVENAPSLHRSSVRNA